jgi:predicted nuclease with TOPRIM domain
MARGLTDPIETEQDNNSEGYLSPKEERAMLYEMQEVLQELIRKHNELYDKYDKMDDKLTTLRVENEALKLVWQKGL